VNHNDERLSYYYNKNCMPFVRLSQHEGRLLASNMRNDIRYLSQGHNDMLPTALSFSKKCFACTCKN